MSARAGTDVRLIDLVLVCTDIGDEFGETVGAKVLSRDEPAARGSGS
jgi:hypothetical protein